MLKEGVAPLPAVCTQSGGVENHAFVSRRRGEAGTPERRRRSRRLARGLELQRLLRVDRWRPDLRAGRGERRDQRRRPRPHDHRVVGGRHEGSTRSSSRHRCSITPKTDQGGTILQGVYVSDGSFAGPWNKIAEWRNLRTAAPRSNTSQGLPPRRAGLVQPVPRRRPGEREPRVPRPRGGLRDDERRRTWNAVGPYWNFGLPCSANGLDSCPPTTHPDQHAVAFGNGNRLRRQRRRRLQPRPEREHVELRAR